MKDLRRLESGPKKGKRRKKEKTPKKRNLCQNAKTELSKRGRN